MIVLYVTCATRQEAERIESALLKERLAACVNIWAVSSRFWWEGKLKRSREWAMFCKTRGALSAKATRRIRRLHSYTLPVIEQWSAKTDSAVERWIKQSG